MATVRYTVLDGEIVGEDRGGTERDYVPNPLGSTVALLNSSQAQTDTLSYWPHGEVSTRSGTSPARFQFGGTRGYSSDGAHHRYARARTMDSRWGRWLAVDPRLSSIAETNRYIYAHNSPASLLDESGMGWPIVVGIAALLGGLIGAVCGGAALGVGISFGLVPPWPGKDKLIHCVTACMMRRCGTIVTSNTIGTLKEEIWDRIFGGGPDEQDYVANCVGEDCAKTVQNVQQCGACCLNVYPPDYSSIIRNAARRAGRSVVGG
jgi:RHS repeat-associated protein